MAVYHGVVLWCGVPLARVLDRGAALNGGDSDWHFGGFSG